MTHPNLEKMLEGVLDLPRITDPEYITRLENALERAIKEMKELSEIMQEEFHLRVCEKSMDCHCRKDELTALTEIRALLRGEK